MQTKYSPDSTEKNYTFDDVQGIDEAKEEVQEVVNFLKNPEKFKRLGAKLPTGVELLSRVCGLYCVCVLWIRLCVCLCASPQKKMWLMLDFRGTKGQRAEVQNQNSKNGLGTP